MYIQEKAMWGHREAGHWQDERSLNKSSQVASRSRTLKYLEFPELWKINLCCLSPLVWYFIMVPLENGFSALQCVCSVAHSGLTLCHPMDYIACQAPLSMEFSRQEYRGGCHFLLQGSSRPRDQTHVSCISCFGRQILYHCTTWEAPSALSAMEDKQLLIQLAGDSEVSHSLWFSFSP